MNFDVKNGLILLLVPFILTNATNGLKVRKNRNRLTVDFIKNVANFLKKFKAEAKVIRGNRGFDDIRSSLPYKLPYKFYKRDRPGEYKTVLLKRLVPKNYETKDYEYDSAFGALYRPLVRLDRKNKQVKFIDREKIKELLKPRNSFDILERPNRGRTAEDDFLLQPFATNLEEAKILNHINNYARTHDPKQVLRLRDSIERNIILNKKLRDAEYYVTQTGLDGKKNTIKHKIKSVVMPEHKLLEGQPEYGYWHYWTYEREILQDHCKGTAVQYGNICIQTPPH